MTTRAAAAAANGVSSSHISSSVYNIQYPNCQRGMYCLRQPFRNVEPELFPINEERVSTHRITPADPQTNLSDSNQVPRMPEKAIEPLQIPPRKVSRRNAEVQCLLLKPHSNRDVAVQTKTNHHESLRNFVQDDVYVSSRRYRQQPPQIYEIRDVESPLSETPSANRVLKYRERSPKYGRTRNQVIGYYEDDDTEFDVDDSPDDERILYARRPRRIHRRSYLPPNVRMVCVRESTK